MGPFSTIKDVIMRDVGRGRIAGRPAPKRVEIRRGVSPLTDAFQQVFGEDIFIHRHLRRFNANFLSTSVVTGIAWAMARTKNHVVEERVTLPPFPAWARIDGAGADPGEAAFLAGAALAILNARSAPTPSSPGCAAAPSADSRCRQHPHRPPWRARGDGARFFLSPSWQRRSGPAGRMLLGWRSLDRSAPLDEDAVNHVAELFGLRVDNALAAAEAARRRSIGGPAQGDEPSLTIERVESTRGCSVFSNSCQ
jgi:hypothetical protein